MDSMLTKRIRDILFYCWDPVNINMNENLSDEYDDYVGMFEDLVNAKKGKCAYIELLSKIESEDMEQYPRNDINMTVAMKLEELESLVDNNTI